MEEDFNWGLNDPVYNEMEDDWGINDPVVGQTDTALSSESVNSQLNFPDEPFLSQQEIDAANLRNQENVQYNEGLAEIERLQDPTSMLDVPEAIGGGLYNAARDTVELGAAGVDLAADTDLAESFNEAVPAYEPESGRKQVVSGLTQVGAGLAGGVIGTGKLLAKAAPNLGRIKSAITTMLGGEVGATITAGSEETLLFNIMGSDPEGEFSENVFRQRADFLAESLVLSGVAGTAVAAGSKAIGFAKDQVVLAMTNWRSLEAREKEFVGTIVDMAADIDYSTMSREEILSRQEAVADYVRNNQETWIKLEDKVIDDPKITRDTVSILQDNPDISPEASAQLSGVRKSALEGRSPRLEQSLEVPARTLDETSEAIYTSRGGAEAVQKTGEDIIESGVRDVAPYQDDVRAARGELAQAERGIEETIRNDPTFAPILSDLGDRVNINLREASTRPANQIAENVMEASRIMTAEKNRLYDAIPETARVNSTALADILEPAIQSGALSDDLATKIGSAGDSFKELNRVANFDIQPEIKRLYDNHEVEKARQLIDIKKNITDDQLDYLAIQGDDVTREAAERARDYYNNEYAPFWRDNPVLEEIQNISRTPYSQKERVAQSRVAVEDQFSDTRIPERTEGIIDLLSRKEAGENTTLAVDYTLGKIANRVKDIINKDGSLTPENSRELMGYLDQFAPILDKVDPAKRVQIEDFFTNLRDQNFDIKTLEKKITDLEKAADEVADRVFNNELREFFGQGQGLPNSQASLGKLLNDPQSGNRVDQILKRLEDNPLALDGLEAAYTKEARKKWFSSKDGSVSTIAPDDPLVQNGKKIFGEDEMNNVVDGLNYLADIAETSQRANITRGGQGLDFQGGQTRFTTAMNLVTTWMFGVLNPKAARIRTVTGSLSKTYSEKEIAKVAGDIILADPKRFSEVLDGLVAKNQIVLTDREKAILRRSAYKAGYMMDDENESDLNNQTNDFTE